MSVPALSGAAMLVDYISDSRDAPVTDDNGGKCIGPARVHVQTQGISALRELGGNRMADARVYREPSPEHPRHPPTQIARLPQQYAHGYDRTAGMERIGFQPAEVSPRQPPRRITAPTFTPHQGMPQQRHGTVPPSPWAGIVRDIRAVALGALLGLVVLAVAIAVSRGFSV